MDLGELAHGLGVELKLRGRTLVGLCPLHQEKTPSFNVDTERHYWKCFGCGKGGDAFALLMEVNRVDFLEAVRDAARFAGLDPADRGQIRKLPAPAKPKPAPPQESPVPVPDHQRMHAYLARALQTLQEDARCERWLHKRGVGRETCAKYCVGFMPWSRFKGWKHSLRDAWVFPVHDVGGQVLAVKLHREDPPEGARKSMWAPFGTQPEEKPRHAWFTLWPAPEVFAGDAWLYVCEGELKALAILHAGRCACSVTDGSGHRWTPAEVARLAGRKVCLVYDADRAGIAFRNRSVEALAPAAAELRVVTFGEEATA